MRFCHIRKMTVTENTYCETRSLLTVECKQYFTVGKAFSHEPRQFDFCFPAALMRNIEAIHLCEKTHVGFLQSSRNLPSFFYLEAKTYKSP